MDNLEQLSLEEKAYQQLIMKFEKPFGYSLAEILLILQSEIADTIEASRLNNFSKQNELVILQSLLTIRFFCDQGLKDLDDDETTQLSTSIMAKTDHYNQTHFEEEG